uniref:Sosondowah ankyrin repeat domain family member B n=1 Tax=Jaculus jaculus TaxID=51337 RepID=A0A8C5LG69_JACJA
MARELSQEALLDFLCQAGGRVTNAALLSHFKSFLRDPDAPPSQHQQRRELFKGFVNSVAAVRQDPDGTKYVVLKRRYRDLLGEERLQRPREPYSAAATGLREEEPEEEEPAGAPARATNSVPASCAQEAAREDRGGRCNPSQRAPGPTAAVARGRCAAAETLGSCCWECQQNSLGNLAGQPRPSATPIPATTWEEPARLPTGLDDPSSSATVEAAGSPATPPALRPRPAPSGDPPGLFTPGSLSQSSLQQQQQQQQQHPQMPEARPQGPIRAWSVLPDNFLQLSPDPVIWVSETNLALSETPRSSHIVFPEVPDESSGSCPGNPSQTVFRSIRCQLSLQDLDDFVDQESHGSEESSSGPKESPGGSEEGLQAVLGSPDWGKLTNPSGGLSLSPRKDSSRRSPQGLGNRGDSHSPQHVPTGLKGLVGYLQDPLPWPAPKFRRSLRRSSRAERAKSFSSDEEYLDEDMLKRNRRPPRSRKPSKAVVVPSPRMDVALVQKLTDVKEVMAEQHSLWVPSTDGPAALVPHRLSEHKSSLVPLDAREHEWIVKLASGSWIQVLTLFWEDPQLALYRDFLTGYTALHWIAKHGDLGALQALVSGAQKAGIALDVNVKSSCGYTPLHLAAIHGHQEVIKLLVQRLASRVNVRDSSGKKPWQYLTSNTSGEIWQLLGAPRGKPIFPVYPLVQSSSPTRKAKSKEMTRNITRKTSLAALLKHQHSKWKLSNQYEKFHALKEREEYSD